MMLNQPPPDLPEPPGERPVSSEFAAGLSYRTRRIITLTVLGGVIVGAIYMGFGRDPQPAPVEDVPVIKAEGSYKQKPQEPGGLEIPHQDADVYKEIEAKGDVAPSAEHLSPPAEVPRPEGARGEAAPSFAQAPTPEEPKVETLAAAPSAALPSLPNVGNAGQTLSELPALPAAQPVATTVAQASTAPVPVAVPVPPPVTAEPVKDVAKEAPKDAPKDAAPQPVPSPAPVRATLHPVADNESPNSLTTPAPDSGKAPVEAKPPVSPVEPAPAAESKPVVKPAAAASTAAKGKIAVQLASVSDEAAAHKTMQQLQAKYASILGGMRLHLVRADLGAKGIFFRIQSEPVPADQATAVCGALKKINAGCLIVR